MMTLKRFRANRSCPALVLGLALLLGAGTAFTQELTGTIYGQVADDQGLAIPGATVTLTSPQHIQTEVRVTGARGDYRVPLLSPGTYTVMVELAGFQTLTFESVVVNAGNNIAINATLSPSGVEEMVTVIGEAPLVDVKSNQAMRTMDVDLIENIPLGRTYSDLLVSMPGVLDSEYSFTPTQTVHGSSPRDNLFNIDGAAMNDTTVGYISTEIPIDMIEEVQVTTGGISAEFGLSMGGVFNFVTKSGGNEFSGTLNGYYQGEELEWSNLTPELEEALPAATSTVKNQEYGGTFGGPIKRDAIWFFGNLRRVEVEQQEPFLPTQPFETNQTHAFLKLTTQMGVNTRFSGSFTTRDQDKWPGNVTSFSNADHPETWNIFFRNQRIINLNATQLIGQNTIIEGRFNGVWKNFNQEYPNNPDFQVGYVDIGTGESFGGITGGVGNTLARDIRQAHLTLSHFRQGLGGSHEFKTGLYWEHSPFKREFFYPNGEDVQQRLLNGVPHRVRLENYPINLQQTNINRGAFFVQDQWTIGEALTLNLGARWVLTEGWYPRQSSGGGRWFPETFVEETRDLITFNSVAPRVGLVWALGEEGRTSIKASYGKYYKPLLNQDTLIILPGSGGSHEYEWFDLNGDRVFQDGEQGELLVNRIQPNTSSADPNLQNTYVNSFHFGIEHQLENNIVLSVSGIFKREKDIMETVDVGRIGPDGTPFGAYNALPVTNPTDGSPMTIYALREEFLGSGRIRFLTNPGQDGPLFRDYNGVEFVARRRWQDGWQLMAALNISQIYGNIGNSYGSTWGGHSIYDNPNSLINAEGPLDLDATYQFKLQASYTLPWDILVSGYYQAVTGFPLKPPENFAPDPALGAYTARFFKDDVPGMVVENFVDVAAVPRGTYRHDFRNKIDLRIEKQFPFRDNMRVGIIADVFNLTNLNRTTAVQSLRYGLADRFLVPAKIEPPRILRIGVRFQF
jgi:hypothetical protein